MLTFDCVSEISEYFCLILTLYLEMDLIPAFATFFACIFYEQLEVGIVIGRREILTLLIFLPVLFLDLLDPDPLVRCTDPDPDSSIIKQK
jgi:hypothetical protein